jgi:glutamate transport system substrate-binding protein
MRSLRYLPATAIAASTMLLLSACGDAGEESSSSSAPEVEVASDTEFPAGSTAAELSEAGKVTIGVKYDQPGIGFKPATADDPEGFDIEMGKIIAAGMGIAADDIDWKETISDNREPFLQNGEVDLVIASYSITPERRAVVGQAGPYYVTGQQLMVAADDDSIEGPEDLEGKKVCSVTGSTSIETVEKEYGAEPAGFETYSECRDQLLNGSVDAVTTDGAILLGYVAENPDELKVVGPEFSEERYGIGYGDPKDTEFCQVIQDTVQTAMDDGTWAEAFEATLGQSGVDTPEPPAMDECA